MIVFNSTIYVKSLRAPVYVNKCTFRNDNRANNISFVKSFKRSFICDHACLRRSSRLGMTDETHPKKGACDFNGGTEKNSAQGLATGLGRIPGEALRIITEANGSSYCCRGRSYEVLKVTHG